MTESVTILHCESFKDYLTLVLQERKATSNKSLRQLAKALGLKSPSGLSMVARGLRLPSPILVRRIARYFSWTATEIFFAETLLLKAKAKTVSERHQYDEELLAIRAAPTKRSTIINSDIFTSTWYATAILEMFHLRGFRTDPDWIAKRLRYGITAKQVTDVLNIMLALGLLKHGEDGTLQPESTFFATPTAGPRQALRTFHRAMLKNAIDSLQSQPFGQRFALSQTLAFDTTKFDAAKKHLDSMIDDFAEKFSVRSGDEVYHCSVQFFRLTQ